MQNLSIKNIDFPNEEPWGIYAHVPWCHRRCPYCDFYIEVGKNTRGFVDALKNEWSARKQDWPSKPAQTLYFGGGTPSILPASELSGFIGWLREQGVLVPNAEITLEGNPEDLTLGYLEAIQAGGVNRLSLGVQSFDDGILKWLGRKHKALDARQAIERAQSAGFLKISVDLIVGVPGEDQAQIAEQIQWLSEVGITHLSVYLLTVEPGTSLAKMIERGRVPLPNEDEQASAYENAQHLITNAGYRQYEISSFAKKGHESQHNRIYWAKGSYLGLGPGAHSMRLGANGSVYRRHTTAKLAQWRLSSANAEHADEVLAPGAALLEAVAFGMRDLVLGVDLQRLSERHQSLLPQGFDSVVNKLISAGWVAQNANRVCLTPLGARFADAVAREILGSAP